MAKRNALWVVGNIISNVVVRSLLTMVCLLVAPVDRQHGQAIHMCHTPRGALEWHIQMARGHMEYLSEVVLVLRDPKALKTAGLLTGSLGQVKWGLSHQDRWDMCAGIFNFVARLLGLELLFNAIYYSLLPGCFAKLLDKDHPDKVTQALLYLCELFDAVTKAQKAAEGDPWLAYWLSGLLWPNSGWILEFLVGLSECEWKKVPADI